MTETQRVPGVEGEMEQNAQGQALVGGRDQRLWVRLGNGFLSSVASIKRTIAWLATRPLVALKTLVTQPAAFFKSFGKYATRPYWTEMWRAVAQRLAQAVLLNFAHGVISYVTGGQPQQQGGASSAFSSGSTGTTSAFASSGSFKPSGFGDRSPFGFQG